MIKEFESNDKYLKAEIEIKKYSPNDDKYWQYQAEIYWNKKYIKLAYDAFRKSLEINSDNMFSRIGLTRVCMFKKDIDEANSNFCKLEENFKNNIEVLLLKYDLQCLKGKNIKDKMDILDSIPIKKLSKLEKYFSEYILLLFKEARYVKCEKACVKYIRTYPDGKNNIKVREIRKKIKVRGNEVIQKTDNTLEDVARSNRIMRTFDDIVGLDNVKSEIESMIKLLEFDKQRKVLYGISEKEKVGYNFVFSGNPGTGKTTVARIIGRILKEKGILKNDKFVEVDRSKLVGQFIGQTAILTSEKIKEAEGGVLFIDEAYSLYRDGGDGKDFGREAIDTLIKAMEDMRGNLSIIFAGYKKEMEILMESNPGLKSRCNIILDFPNYTDKEIVLIAGKMAKEKSFIISKEGEKALLELVNRERVDENFANARTVRNIIEKAVRNKAIDLAGKNFTKEEATLLDGKDFGIDSFESNEIAFKRLQSELDSLIGLESLKIQMNNVFHYVKYQKIRKNEGYEVEDINLHMAFVGNPGTGKTTVARLAAKMFKALGVLKKGHFVECTRTDLVGEYQGKTAIKTEKVIKRALGGVLFIDEAYSLFQGDNDSFGKEAIDVLTKNMEDYREDLIVIVAGYPKEIKELLASNIGLSERVKTEIIFEDYDSVELFEIFSYMVKKQEYVLEEKCLPYLKGYFRELYENKDEVFGNARTIRNYFERVKVQQGKRVVIDNVTGDGINLIKVEDLGADE